MKKTLLALLALSCFSANAAYVQAHDPHVVAPFSVTCKAKEVVPPVDPGEINNPDGYYDLALNKSGDELKAALNTIISTGIKKLPYSSSSFDVWDALDITDEDPNNPDNVILIYTGRSQAKGQKTGQGSLGGDNWNREHSYPKSNGGFNNKSAYGYTDIHHLRPSDETVNSTRGNLEYDYSENPVAESPENRYDSDSFEPRDAVKGDVARMMFYMATRYEGKDSITPDLELVPSVLNNGTALGNVCSLLEWNKLDPVDEFESNRNTKIQQIQGNRNPFVDNPQWADEIFAKNCK
ncbi:ribonuclease [Photobacterium proteolyticum]|uniref:Ribonuclease n=1 Tax=Photobacterium proteolyticum TaxID=1903952 RepID=A0A1Q9GM23_9GAMM|nr:endonuclease [Photobacterium proteolyticum]OLQ75576.1 ribonuclease [Photobacterium proteolyticum]